MNLDADGPNRERRFFSGPFLLAAFLLLAAGVLIGPVAGWANLRQVKLALPLKKSLSALEEMAVVPYRVVNRRTLEPTVIEALGTDQYIDWSLEDSSAGSNDPLRYASLFITYESGGANLVPHTPDECRLGAGYQPVQAHENRKVHLPSMPVGQTDPQVRLCTFMKTAVFNREENSVVYTFCANGRILATRNEVRLAINDPRDRHAYFSKVEVSFPRASREQTLQGAHRLFDRLLPVLLREHWPDVAAAEGRSKQ